MQIGCHWKFDPTWPLDDTNHAPTHSKLYIFVILITSNLIYMKGHLKHFENLTPTWPLCAPTGKGPNRPKFCQNFFWPITILKLSVTHFRQNGTSSTTSSFWDGATFHWCAPVLCDGRILASWKTWSPSTVLWKREFSSTGKLQIYFFTLCFKTRNRRDWLKDCRRI